MSGLQEQSDVCYRAYCADELCKWTAILACNDEEDAWLDLQAHMDNLHWPLTGFIENYKPYCDDPLCRWRTTPCDNEEEAWLELQAHMDNWHWPLTGVRKEEADGTPKR